MATEDTPAVRDFKYVSGDFFNIIIERIAYFKKHPSFSIEREYRLLVDNMLLG
jgi:hypothetical protein